MLDENRTHPFAFASIFVEKEGALSIDITVGSFAYIKGDDFHQRYLLQFDAINRYLRSVGLPEHHEPEHLEGKRWFQRTGTRTLPALKSLVWHLERHLRIPFPHLSKPPSEHALYLPVLFEEVLQPSPKWGIEIPALGSSVKLFEECWLLAKVLGICDGPEDGLEDDHNRYGQVPFSRDPLVLQLERLLDLNKRERNTPLLLMRKQVLRWNPLLAENPWVVHEVIGCADLYAAAKCSVKHQAAVVIS